MLGETLQQSGAPAPVERKPFVRTIASSLHQSFLAMVFTQTEDGGLPPLGDPAEGWMTVTMPYIS